MMNSNELIDKEFTLDLGSTPVKVVVKNITKDKVIVEYLNSTPGRMEEFTISDFEYFAMIKIDNNKDLIEDAYVNYCKHFVGYDDIPKIDWFIQEIKNNIEFSEKWGLKIEEREILKQIDQTNPILKGSTTLVPTKLITITYNNERIESYE